MNEQHLDDQQSVALCEVLDRVLNKGVYVSGEVTIAVADIDLIYISLHAMIASFDKALGVVKPHGEG